MATAPRRNSRASAGPRLDDSELYVNRELSWLDFNARVLALAADRTVPLAERCKFLAIFSSNLDEFFMVRVAGHLDALEAMRPSSAPDGMTREDTLAAIAARAGELVAEQGRLWKHEIAPALAREGLAVFTREDLDDRAMRKVKSTFTSEIFPVLTPLALSPGQPFPYISGLSLNMGATVTDPTNEESRFARVKLTPGLPRFLRVPGGVVPSEQIVRSELARVFPGMEVTDTALFRVTRDADFSISDEADDLLGAVEAQLHSRRFGDVVRLEVERSARKGMVSELAEQLGVVARDVYRISGLLDLTCLWELADSLPGELRERPWEPRIHPRLRADVGEQDIFAAMRQEDILVHHPYDDFHTSVGRFIDQAAADPDVVAIKQTIYRTSGDTPIVPALMRAAEQGKAVVCLVELQARFDEQRNIQWARALERSGVHVVYGLAGRKTHAKLALVVRREGKKMRRYAHIGTGNYHPSTARLYTDFGLFTCRPNVTEDVHDLFNYLTGFSRVPKFRKLWVAPEGMRDRLIAQIVRVTKAHRSGTPGRIVIKMNAIIDGEVIQTLYRASQAGVPIELLVRGICGLRPGVAGVSETIRVTSVVGRFLEHTRVCAFTSGEHTAYWIGSADLMGRNLDNRVEVMTPVEDPAACAELAAVLDITANDTALAWEMQPDGTWRKLAPADGTAASNTHEVLMERAIARERAAILGAAVI